MRREDLHRQAWEYFALHAQQRLTTLNFYLVIALALTASTVASFQKDFAFPVIRIPAGGLLALLSFAFWRLDVRNRHLIKSAEAALRCFETADFDESGLGSPVHAGYLFTREHRESQARTRRWYHRFVPQTYSEVFEFLFGSFWLLGMLIVAQGAATSGLPLTVAALLKAVERTFERVASNEVTRVSLPSRRLRVPVIPVQAIPNNRPFGSPPRSNRLRPNR